MFYELIALSILGWLICSAAIYKILRSADQGPHRNIIKTWIHCGVFHIPEHMRDDKRCLPWTNEDRIMCIILCAILPVAILIFTIAVTVDIINYPKSKEDLI